MVSASGFGGREGGKENIPVGGSVGPSRCVSFADILKRNAYISNISCFGLPSIASVVCQWLMLIYSSSILIPNTRVHVFIALSVISGLGLACCVKTGVRQGCQMLPIHSLMMYLVPFCAVGLHFSEETTCCDVALANTDRLVSRCSH